MKKLMLGNEAIARGAFEAGVNVVSSYPGTPSTEVSEAIAGYEEVYAEWAPNEKVALEVAIGASYAGARSLVCMKHVGVNVAADPLFTCSYTGVNGGLVVFVADDPGMHSSQNEQDSRYYAKSAHIPMLEPANSQEAKEFMKLAYEVSEKYDTPVFVRSTTRLSHSQSFVEQNDRVEIEVKPYLKDIKKYAMMPACAIARHKVVEAREDKLASDIENNSTYFTEEILDTKMGVLCSGVVYEYVKEALPNVSVMKLNMVYPMPMDSIKKFADKVDELVVIEELEPIFETELKAQGIACRGKELFSKQGEVSVGLIKEKILGIKQQITENNLPVRPPVMCAGCPHRGVFYVLNKMKLTVSADIGCYTLGAQPPLSAVDTVVCMGASIGVAHGFEKAVGTEKGKKVVSVIGDSTFVHSGLTGVVNAVYNKSNLKLLILDNSTTGMTGHQDNPATGKTLKGEATYQLDLVDVCKALGVPSIRVCDAYDMKGLESILKEEIEKDGVSVIVAQKPCALLTKKYPPAFTVDTDKCKKCGACLKIGCPAIEKQKDGSVLINPAICVGCGLCDDMCKFGAIQGGNN